MPDVSRQSTAHGEVEIVVDPAALACALADHLVMRVSAAIKARGTCSVALAGGTTPRAAYALLAMQPRRDAIDWSKVSIFFGDERCVPPTSDQSNFRMAQETLLSHVPLAPERVFRMRGEVDPPQAAEEYARVLTQQLGDEPRFDVVMLGLGPDAHTASWFPGASIDESLLVDAPYVPKFSAHRLTLTPRVVNAADAVIVATSGSEKADAFAAVFSAERNPKQFPAQRLEPANGSLTWLVDRSAARLAFEEQPAA